MRHIMIMAAVLAISITGVEAKTCRHKPDGAGWAWRQVDGKRCWYHGSRRIGKHRLHWPVYARDDKPPPVTEPKKEPTLKREPTEDELLLRSYWPVLERDTFEDRFTGEKRK